MSGPKISTFLTLPNSDSGCKAALPEVPMGNEEKLCTFMLAWKCFHYISEVSGLKSNCCFGIFLLELFLFFVVEDKWIMVEYAYSFLRSIFNTAQRRFYYIALFIFMFLSTSYWMCSFCPCQAQFLYFFILSSGVRLLYVHVHISFEMKLVFPPNQKTSVEINQQLTWHCRKKKKNKIIDISEAALTSQKMYLIIMVVHQKLAIYIRLEGGMQLHAGNGYCMWIEVNLVNRASTI